MKIAKLKIENFRGISKLSLDLSKINVFLGPCGASKTSTVEALKWALTGDISTTDIKVGTDKALVEIEFSDGTVISRSKSYEKGSAKVNGKTTTQKSCDEFMEEKFGCSINVIRSMCGADFLESLDKKDLTKFILSILPIKVSLEKLFEFSEEKLERIMSSDEKKFLLNYFIDSPDLVENQEISDSYLSTTISLEKIDDVYKRIYDDRRVVNSSIKNLKGKTIFDKEKLPSETKQELDELLKEINVAEEKIKDYKNNLEKYEKSLKLKNDAEKKLKSLKDELLNYGEIKKPDENELNTAKNHKKQFEDAIISSNNIIATNRANIEMYTRTLKSLNTSVCPLSEKLICNTDKSGLKAELEELIKKNEFAISEAQNFIIRCNEQIEKRNKCIEEYSKNLIKWTQSEALKKQISDFVIPQVIEKPVEIKADVLLAKKVEVVNKIAIWTEYDACNKYSKDLKELEDKLKLLEFGVYILDAKTGVRSKVLEKSILPLENIVNAKAEKLRHEFKISFCSPNGMEINVAPKGKDFVPTNKISSGEFIFTAYLIMSAIRKITGVSIIIIDNIDKLDANSTKMLINLIEKDNEYENVILAGVDHIDTINSTTATSVNVINF